MNEQDMILKEKIEKREKFDTILAYVLLVVLLGCIALVLWLKFSDNDEELDPPVDEYVPTYMSLSDIANSLNNSTLAKEYMDDNASFMSSFSDNNLLVTYTKDDVNVSLNIPSVGSELVINIGNENSDIITDIYEEIANVICVYYGNEEKYCRNTLDNMTSEGLDGIRFDNSGENNTVYITTTKSFTVNNEILYKEIKIMDINESGYALELDDIKISNVSVATSDIDVVFAGNIRRLTEDSSNLAVMVKLYDSENNVLGENKYEYNEENVLEQTGTFEITFILNDTLKLNNISKYSIEIVK